MTALSYLYHNGSYLPSHEAFVSVSNRSFRYGDGLFESVALLDGRLLLLPLHLQRLLQGMQVLQMAAPSAWHQTDFWQAIIAHLAHLHHCRSARIRIQVYRNDGGWYLPTQHTVGLLVELLPLLQPLPHFTHTIPNQAYTLGVYTGVQKPYSTLSALKTTAALPYVIAAQYAQQHGYHDCVLLNPQQQIADSCGYNLFARYGSCLYTPPISDGGVAGVMRHYLLDLLSVAKRRQAASLTTVATRSLSVADLHQADELLLSNAVVGIRAVQRFEQQHYQHHPTAHQLSQLLNHQLSRSLQVTM